jgi:hypothetical protein
MYALPANRWRFPQCSILLAMKRLWAWPLLRSPNSGLSLRLRLIISRIRLTIYFYSQEMRVNEIR